MNNSTKERPILFSSDMVRALIQEYHHPGQCKNQTRRTRGLDRFNDFPKEFDPGIKCPYGKKGDRLWVREAFCYKVDTNDQFIGGQYWYRATDPDVRAIGNDGYGLYRKDGTERSPWIPSIHMPRKASRILLEITEVRIERLQEITWRDAQLEGIECVWYDEEASVCLWRDYSGRSTGFAFEREAYFSLWEKINGPHSVNRNPWVWVIKFRVLTINGEYHE